MRLSRTWLSALLLSLAAGACRDLPTAAPAPQPAEPAREQLRCAVEVRARTVSCDPTGPRGIRRQIIMGGQGLNVRLRTTNVVWNGSDNVLDADISVQNLLDQPLGTDGNGGTYGVRVFFVSGPNVTDGSGEVTVLADSVGTFTAANQKYYVYPEIIQPRGVSSPVTWEFSVPPTALRFEFMVLVETQTPAETSALHFRPEHGSPVYGLPLNNVWAASAHDVFAVSEGTVLHYDGNYWRAMDAGSGCGCESSLYGVWGSDGRDVWAVGSSGNLRHWTGTGWDAVDVPEVAGTDLYSIWGANADDFWVVGDAGTFLHYDGSWTTDSIPGFSEPVASVWGANVENIWAVTPYGTIVHYDGGGWQQDTAFASTGLYSVWGTADDDVWAAGDAAGDGGLTGVLYHYDGTGWTQVTDPEIELTTLFAGWSSGPNDVWVNSGGEVLHWDGGTWTRLAVGSGAPLYGITGSGPADVFAVGEFGTIAHSTGGAFTDMALAEFFDVHSLWGSGAGDVWAVGGPIILHRTGSASWAPQIAPDGVPLNAVWGASASQVWAAGEGGTVIHYDGSDWATAYTDSAAGGLNGVWGSSASDVWVVGNSAAVLHWNGAAWSGTTEGVDDLLGVWGSGPDDVFAVGDNGAILHWTGGGWTAMNSGTADLLYGVWGSGPGDVYAVGDNGTVLHYDGNPAGDWTSVATGAPAASVFAIWGSGANDVFILANNGLDLMHWDGAAWKTMSQYSANADVWMYTLWGSSSRNVFAAGDVGTILHGTR